MKQRAKKDPSLSRALTTLRPTTLLALRLDPCWRKFWKIKAMPKTLCFGVVRYQKKIWKSYFPIMRDLFSLNRETLRPEDYWAWISEKLNSEDLELPVVILWSVYGNREMKSTKMEAS